MVSNSLEPRTTWCLAATGLDQCLTLVEDALRADPGPEPEPGWLSGTGMAMAMIDTIPPRGHHADARSASTPTGTTPSESARPNSATAPAQCTGRSRPRAERRPGARARRRCGHRCGRPRYRRLWQHRHGGGGPCDAPRRRGARGADPNAGRGHVGYGPRDLPPHRRDRGDGERIAPARGSRPARRAGRADGTPRSVSFNVQGFRVAVHPVSGEVRILRSVHAADAGRVINPMQCRGQVEGGVAQAIGAALYEDVRDRCGGAGRDTGISRLPHPGLRRRAGPPRCSSPRPIDSVGRSVPSR